MGTCGASSAFRLYFPDHLDEHRTSVLWSNDFAEKVDASTLDAVVRLQPKGVGAERPAGTLSIGSPESVLTYRLPPVLQEFRSTFPEVDLAFRSSGTRDLIPQLEQGELDIGLVIDDAFEHPRLHIEALCEEPLSLLVRPDHPLLREPGITAEHLAGEPFLLTDVGWPYRSKLEKALANSHSAPKSIMEFTSVETIKQCVALGMGIACLPAIVAESDIAAGKLASLRWPRVDLSMRTLVVWHKDKWLSPAMSAFISMLRQRLALSRSGRGGAIRRAGINHHHRSGSSPGGRHILTPT